MKSVRVALFCALLLVLAPLRCAAHLVSVTVILHPVADTDLFEAVPDNNMGGSPTLVVGATQQGKRGRALLRFDVGASIPTNAIILNAYLNITVGKAAANSASSTVRVHRFLQGWVEGVQADMNGDPAAKGEPSWNSQSSPNLSWAQPGGKSGTDYASTPSAAQTFTSAGEVDFDSTTNTVFDVQTWINDPSSNHGWMLISSAEDVGGSAVRINSREATDSPPELTVVYFIPDPIFRIEEAEKNGIYFLVHLNLEAGNAYTLQFRDNLDTNAWQIATNFPPDASFRHYIWAETYTNMPHRFFRFGVTKPAGP